MPSLPPPPFRIPIEKDGPYAALPGPSRPHSIGASQLVICLNSIIDIDDIPLTKELKLNERTVTNLKRRFLKAHNINHKVEKVIEDAITNANKLETVRERYSYLTLMSLEHDNDTRKKLDIIVAIFRRYIFNKNDADNWKKMSIYTIVIKIWSSIFEILFEDEDHINLSWGETKNDDYKVDLRICLFFNNINYDISNIEFKKNGDNTSSIKEDHGKVLAEGKTILNKLATICNKNLEEAKKLEVTVVQICGLKAVFRKVQLVAPGAYMGST